MKGIYHLSPTYGYYKENALFGGDYKDEVKYKDEVRSGIGRQWRSVFIVTGAPKSMCGC